MPIVHMFQESLRDKVLLLSFGVEGMGSVDLLRLRTAPAMNTQRYQHCAFVDFLNALGAESMAAC